ncbi:hypothetical protein NQ314_018772 [Rhamnusium bicolor]|uniref:Uncharacterized protein n=1 Tax=Rhamnusium bicolor TaxID=1586634 RepID=A0AAV8WQB3_9CUCU|nr:hypothetical protein NQ314_018772 [Rhamnusium bicolor]
MVNNYVVLHKAVRFPTVQQHYFRVPLKKISNSCNLPIPNCNVRGCKRVQCGKEEVLFSV